MKIRIFYIMLFSVLCFETLVIGDSCDKKGYPYLYFQADELPVFQHEKSGLIEYVYSRIEWPNGLEVFGTVVVSFTVTDAGEVCDIQVVRSLAKQCDEQVIRILKNMPKWKPGKIDDKYVSVTMFLPIDFKIYAH